MNTPSSAVVTGIPPGARYMLISALGFALMAACVLSTLVSQILSRDSIYTEKLTRQGVDIFRRSDPNPLKELHVRDVIDRAPEVIPASANFQVILDLVVQSAHYEFFVVDDQHRLQGAISLSEVRRLIYEREALQQDQRNAAQQLVARQEVKRQVVQAKPPGGEKPQAKVKAADPKDDKGKVKVKKEKDKKGHGKGEKPAARPDGRR